MWADKTRGLIIRESYVQRFKLTRSFFPLNSLARTSSQFERADVAGSCSCREEMTPNSLSERAITKYKSGKIKKKSFCPSNEQTPSPPQLAASKSFPGMELVKENNVCQGVYDASPVIPEYSLVLLLLLHIIITIAVLAWERFVSLFIELYFRVPVRIISGCMVHCTFRLSLKLKSLMCWWNSWIYEIYEVEGGRRGYREQNNPKFWKSSYMRGEARLLCMIHVVSIFMIIDSISCPLSLCFSFFQGK